MRPLSPPKLFVPRDGLGQNNLVPVQLPLPPPAPTFLPVHRNIQPLMFVFFL